MKLLKFLAQAFPDKDNIIGTSIKLFMRSERDKMNDDKKFVHHMIYWLGGRSYNKFLDYGLLALKFAHYVKTHDYPDYDPETNFSDEIDDVVTKLLFDDRHDLYQNLPYIFERLNYDNDFYVYMANAIIDCINIYGDGDVAYNFKIVEEK